MSRRFYITACIVALLVGAAFSVETLKITGNSSVRQDASIVYPNSYSSPQDFMQGIYDADQKIDAPSDVRIRAIIVPHHLVASGSIASGIKMLGKQRFTKVLLLSPDHFDSCPTVLCSVNGSFETLFGKVHATTNTVDTLKASSLVTEKQSLFTNEHGIYAVLPFIRHYFPSAEVTPLVLSQKLPWWASKNEIVDLIGTVLDDDTVLIVSSDFSHYLSLENAEKYDEDSAKVIFAKYLDGIAALKSPDQSDCPGCLWTLAKLANDQGFYNPSVIRHTNSAVLLSDKKIPTTTSHFSMAWYENASLSGQDFAVAGDVTLTRGVPKRLPPQVRDWWSGSGARYVNLEGPVAEQCFPRSDPYLFCNLESSWLGLRDIATHWGIMNNHMFDLGEKGFAETKRLILSSGEGLVTTVPAVGDKVRLIAVSALLNPVEDAVYSSLSLDDASVISALSEKHADLLNVVLVHGGDEYHALSRDAHMARYERYIDAGADAVLVAHSHVVGDMRLYNGKPIFLGIGNFIFDQKDRVETSTAKLVRLRKIGNKVLFETFITHIK